MKTKPTPTSLKVTQQVPAVDNSARFAAGDELDEILNGLIGARGSVAGNEELETGNWYHPSP